MILFKRILIVIVLYCGASSHAFSNKSDDIPIVCGKIGFLYKNGVIVNKDYRKSIFYLKKAVAYGNFASYFTLGELYEGEIRNKKLSTFYIKKGFRECEIKVMNHNAYACYILSALYASGTGVNEDVNKSKKFLLESIRLYQKKVNNGNSDAMVKLGFIYQYDEQAQINYEKAKALYLRASKLGNPQGFKSLGDMYKYGSGLKMNSNRAYGLYSKAMRIYKTKTRSGSIQYIIPMALAYELGDGVPKNHKIAVRLVEKAENAVMEKI